MTFEEYQEKSGETAIYPRESGYIYPTLGLAGEVGEVVEAIKKAIRDANGEIDDERKELITKELGDVLWYMAQLSTELGIELDDVAVVNLAKLASRKERGVLGGSGDNR